MWKPLYKFLVTTSKRFVPSWLMEPFAGSPPTEVGRRLPTAQPDAHQVSQMTGRYIHYSKHFKTLSCPVWHIKKWHPCIDTSVLLQLQGSAAHKEQSSMSHAVLALTWSSSEIMTIARRS
jgi:hypothetical protein